MRPLKYGLRCLAAKDNSTTHIAAAPRNLDAATTMQSADRVAKHNRNCSSKTHFVRDVPEKVKVEDVKTKLWCETSLKNVKVEDVKTTKLSCKTSLKFRQSKTWKRSFCARPPSKSERGRCENEAFVRDFPQNLKVEAVETKLSCETSLKIWQWKMWKRSFRARRPSNLKDQVVKMKPELAVPPRGRSENDHGSNERVPKPFAGQASPSIFRGKFCPAKHSISCIHYLSKTHFVRGYPQKVRVEDVKTKLSCETSLKIWKWKMWKRSFRARRPSNLKDQVVKMKPELAVPPRGRSENDHGSNECVPKPFAGQASPSIFRGKFCPAKHSISCIHYLSKTHFVRGYPQKVRVEDVKTKLSCETSLNKKWKWKMWKQAFVQDIFQKVKVEDVKTKLSCENSFKKWKWKMSERSFRSRHDETCDSGDIVKVVI